MDTLTHALGGVLLGRAIRCPDGRVPQRAWIVAFAVSAAFPDVDYVFFLVDAMDFLNLHRGPTHSMVLLPLWAALIALPLSRILDMPWRICVSACALGLLAHIVGDWITLYGVRLFYPLSDHAYALGISFDFNLWIAVVTAAGVLACAKWRPRQVAYACLAVIAVLLAGQAYLKLQAFEVAAKHARTWGLDDSAIRVLPQPLSPFHWSLVIPDGGGYRLAYLDLLDGNTFDVALGIPWLERMMAAYRPRNHLAWTAYAGPEQETLAQKTLAQEAWAHPRIAAFRRFAQLPALLGIEQSPDATCVWFTDLRHALPALPPTFRYGLCRSNTEPTWRPYRLRYYSADQRQAL